MEYKVVWGDGFMKGNLDASKVYSEVKKISNDVAGCKPKDLVDFARNNPNSESHGLFTWDDTVAGEKYRIYEARLALNHINIVEVKRDKPIGNTSIRLLHKTIKSDGYKPLSYILSKPDEREILLERAKKELKAFEYKYSKLHELKPVFDAIDAI